MPLFTLLCRISEPRIHLVESMDVSQDYREYVAKGKNCFEMMTSNTEQSGIISTDHHYYLYLLDKETSVCFLTFCDKSYPRKLALQFLEEVKMEFMIRHGEEVKQKKLRPYPFQKFDNFIVSTKKLYKDVSSQHNLNKVASDLQDITKMAQQNLNDIIERGVKIERVSSQADELLASAKRWEGKTKTLVWKQWLRSWGVVGFIGLFTIFLVIYLFWFS